jgi:excisionase family DNA binding protein
MTARPNITDALSANGRQDHGAAAQASPLDRLSEPLLTADDAAALLRVRRSTVYELARTRRLPRVRVGRRICSCGQTSPRGSWRTASCRGRDDRVGLIADALDRRAAGRAVPRPSPRLRRGVNALPCVVQGERALTRLGRRSDAGP